MALMTYIRKHPKTGVYEFRRIVPEALRAHVGKREIRRSLATRDPNEAKRRGHEVAAEIDRLFHEAETGGAPVAAASANVAKPVARQPCRAEMEPLAEALADAWRRENLDDDAEQRIFGPTSTQRNVDLALREERESLAMWRGILNARDWTALAPVVEMLLRKAGMDAAPGSEAHTILSHAVTRAAVSFYEAVCARSDGRWTSPSTVVVAADRPVSRPAPVAEPTEAGGDGPTLRDLFTGYAKERKPPARTVKQIDKAIRQFEQSVGSFIPAATITKKHVRVYKELMLDCPRTVTSSERKLTLPDLVSLYRSKGEYKKISNGTLTKDIAFLSAIMNWAEKEELIAVNPFKNAKPPKDKKSKKRDIFSDADVVTILKAPLFTGCASARHWKKVGSLVVKNKNYWLTLLGLYTGARLEELGQSLLTDVRREMGVWFVDINTFLDGSEESDEEQKSTKTEASIRKVPLHPMLIRLGFLRYVWRLRKRGERFLFPDLSPNQYGDRTQAWSTWFGRFLDSISITAPSKTYHSFRHTFKTAARRAGIAEDIHDHLTGHTGESVGRRYGEAGDLPFLAAEVAQITYGLSAEKQLEALCRAGRNPARALAGP